MGVAKRVLAFDSFCGARMEVAKCALVFDSLCGAGMGVRECLVAFESLRTGLVIVTSIYCVCVFVLL